MTIFLNIPDMTIKDVDAYFLYHKDPATGGFTNFVRQMKKVKNSAMKDLLRTLNIMNYKRNQFFNLFLVSLFIQTVFKTSE